jgi:hypothetical protein
MLEPSAPLALALLTCGWLIQAGQQYRVRVDLFDRLPHLLVNPLLNGAQLLPGPVEGQSQVLSCRDYDLTRRDMGGICRKLPEAVEQPVDGVVEPGPPPFIENRLHLIHGAQKRFETALLLDFFVDQKFQDYVADTLDSLEIHPLANRNPPCNPQGGLSQDCELPGVIQRVEVGEVIRNSVKGASLGKKGPHLNRKASE